MTRSLSRRLLFGWLIVALIGAQALGLRHAIVHADRIAAGALATRAVAQVADPQWSTVAEHSCAAYDAATLGASAPTLVAALPGGSCVAAPRVASMALDPQSRAALAYRSRAPPLSFLA